MIRLVVVAVLMGALAGPVGQSPLPTFDSSQAATQKLLAGSCANLTLEHTEAPLAAPSNVVQTQLACDGYLFAGKPHHADFVFGDDRLLMVSIATSSEEEADNLEVLAKSYGRAFRPNKNYWLFAGRGAAVRRDKPSVLLFSDRAAKYLEPNFRPPVAPRPSINQWIADIDGIVAKLRALHPDPFTKTGQTTFYRAAAALKSDIPSLSEPERVARAMQLIGLIGDGHTQLEPDRSDFASWYPLRIVEFSDGYFVTTAYNAVRDLAGAQVIEIAGRPIREVAEHARSLRGSDNDMGVKVNLYALHNAVLMRALGYAKANGAMHVKFRLRDGTTVERELSPLPGNDGDSTFEWTGSREFAGPFIGRRADWTAAFGNIRADRFKTPDPSRPLALQSSKNYYAVPLPKFAAYYIQVVWAHDDADEAFVPFFQRALLEVDRLKPKRLILDFRRNIGGDGSRYKGVIHEFIKREDHRPWGSLYILTGPKCFSACILAEGAFLDHTAVSIVGEPPGAALNSFGDSEIGSVAFPATGLHLNVSGLRHLLSESDDLREFAPVDVPSPESFSDYVSGRDTALDAILSGTEMRNLTEIARLAGAEAATKIYHDRKARFSRIAWWSPAAPDDLNTLGNDLRRQKKFTEAVGVLKLNTEIFPNWWNAWDSLGEAELAANMKQEGTASYERALELNPDDGFAKRALNRDAP